MHLDDDKVNAWEARLRSEKEALRRELDSLPLSAEGREHRRRALDEVAAKQAHLAALVSRNILRLTRVTKKVFVSTRFEDGDLPPWLRRVFDDVRARHEERHRGRVEFLVGAARVGHDFRQVILERLIECHYFLSVITADAAQTEADGTVWPIRPYLVEEIGAAFPLPKLTLIAVERGLDPGQVGRLFGEGWQRLIFGRTEAGLAEFAAELSDALQSAPEVQAADVARKKQLLTLFA